MKILMIAPQPFFTPRGTPFSVYYRLKSLSEIGHHVDLLTYHIGRDISLPNLNIIRIVSIPFIKTIKIGPSAIKAFLDIFVFFHSFWLLLRNRYDVIHAHEEAIFFCLIYKFLFRKTKIVYDMHSSLPQQLKNFSFAQKGPLIWLFQKLEILSIKIADVVITICPELQDLVLSLNLKTPSILIENSICHEVKLSDRGDDIQDDLINWGKFKGKKLILYTGTFEYYQGLPLLLESVKQVVERDPKVVFILAGGSAIQVVKMRMMAEKIGIKDHIVFTGNIHPNTVKCFIKRAELLVSPRMKGNNTPLKLYEYLASGKPIVATDHQTHTQILTEKEAVLAGVNPQSFADGILSVLNQPELKESLGREAQQLYNTRYSEEVYNKNIRKVFSLCHR